MQYSYRPNGVCARRIDFEIENDKIKNVEFYGGCPGNLTAISKLVKGMDIKTVKETLKGIRCGAKSTSCADQLVQALEAVEKESGKNK